MKLERVKVHNYRNIDGIDVWLNSDVSYILGENNLGKSNFLRLLSIVCNGKGFAESDYSDAAKAIEVELQIKMNSDEIGFFGDNCDPDDESIIHLRYSQNIADTYPTLLCADTDDAITLKQIKKVDFYIYDSTATPSKELQFNSGKGLASFVQGIISTYVEANKPSFFNDKDVGNLQTFINNNLNMVKGLKKYGIEASVSNDTSDMVSNLFFLSDGQRKIENAGAGVQYMAMASIAVLAHITALFSSKTVKFADRMYKDEHGMNVLPIILAIDEPEVHLHPYLQRSLIKFYKKILNNEDSDFNFLLLTCFGVDRLDGQLLVVTHSTDALVDDYRNIVRFYKENDITRIVSGADPAFGMSDADKKQLIQRFPDIKAAFYAHVVVLIEGETEYGCMPLFADKLGVDLDDHGICIINAQGESSIKPLASLFKHFGIKTVLVYDGDVKGGAIPSDTEFYSSEPCFEFEIARKLCDTGNFKLLKNIACEVYAKALTEVIDADFIKKPYTRKLGLDINNYAPTTLGSVAEGSVDFYNLYSCWLYAKKGVLTGRVIGENIDGMLIPDCYSKAIYKARDISL